MIKLRPDRTTGVSCCSPQGILYETNRVKVDFSAGATSLVESDESNARSGMPDLDPAFGVGPGGEVPEQGAVSFATPWNRMTIPRRGALP